MEFWKPSPPKSGFKKAELHTHSTFSDGVFDPEILAEKCKEAGVQVWALTDHDTTAGCARAKVAAEKRNIQFISGIEISAHYERSVEVASALKTESISVHVLGYHVDPDLIAAYSTKQIRLRRERMLVMIERLKEQGLDIELDDIKLSEHADVYTRPHIARALVEKGYGTSIQDVFDRYIGATCPAYVASDWPGVEEAIEIIHDAGGTAVLAHPGIYKFETGENLDAMIPTWKEAGLDGMEAFHPRHSKSQEKKYEGIANALNLFWTSSSDFHGPEKIGAERFGKIFLSGSIFSKNLKSAAVHERSAEI